MFACSNGEDYPEYYSYWSAGVSDLETLDSLPKQVILTAEGQLTSLLAEGFIILCLRWLILATFHWNCSLKLWYRIWASVHFFSWNNCCSNPSNVPTCTSGGEGFLDFVSSQKTPFYFFFFLSNQLIHYLSQDVRNFRRRSKNCFNPLFPPFLCAGQTEAEAAELCDTAKHEQVVFKTLSPQYARDCMCLLGMFLLQ